jgi:hypothetical protein
MKFLTLIKLIFFALIGKLSGKQTGNETPVLAGLDAIVKYEGKTIGYATNVSFDEDFELQGIRTLGFHGDRDFKSLGYNCNVTVGTFVLQGDVDDALPTPSRSTILQSGLVDFELIDLNTGTTLYLLSSCKCATKGVAFEGTSLATKNTTWRCREVKEKTVS